jgi:hypothetical protein
VLQLLLVRMETELLCVSSHTHMLFRSVPGPISATGNLPKRLGSNQEELLMVMGAEETLQCLALGQDLRRIQ